MQYQIEVDEELNGILTQKAALRDMSVPALIAELLKRYAVDPHIMEQSAWEDGARECAELELDWAAL